MYNSEKTGLFDDALLEVSGKEALTRLDIFRRMRDKINLKGRYELQELATYINNQIRNGILQNADFGENGFPKYKLFD